MSRPITRNPTEETKNKQQLATRPDLFAVDVATIAMKRQ